MIFDTNVLIYVSKFILKPENIFSNALNSISVVTKIEALGYNFHNIQEHQLLVDLCNELSVIPLTDEIADETIKLRQGSKVKLADAIIYSTALVEQRPLVTNNISDFNQLGGKVQLLNPFTL